MRVRFGDDETSLEMSGTRIGFDWSYRGFQACILENEFLRLAYIPEIGAKLHEMVYKPLDRDLLFHHPRVELRQPVFGANVDNWWTGGMDDAIPTGHPCEVDGEELPFLGEVWSLPWQVEQVSTTAVRFTRDGIVTPLRISRLVELRPAETFIRVGYEITNLGTAPLSFIWGLHPGLPVGEATEIDVPAATGIVDTSVPEGRFRPGQRYSWPDDRLSAFPAEPAGTWDYHYLTDLSAGWLAVRNRSSRAGFGIEFPVEVFKCVWLWAVDGGWRGIRCVAVEPWTSWPGRLDEAIKAGTQATLEPGARLAADVRILAFEESGPVAGFDPSGAPLPA